MKQLILSFVLFCTACLVNAQTTTVSSGNWSDVTVWSTGVVPVAATDVNVTNPLVLDQNITIGTGDYLIFQNITDLPGGTAYTLTSTTTGGVLDIKAGTTTFEGAAAFDNSTLIIRNGATLILGPTTFDNGTAITIEVGGTLIINGDLTNNNNGSGTFTISGLVQVNGNYSAPVGSVSVAGTGNFFTTGTITTTGSSNVFGSTNNCNAGPCSGNNLCSFSNIAAASQTLCSGVTPAGLTANSVASSPVYSWESSTSSTTSGFALASGTNNGHNYTPTALSQTTYYRRKVTQGGCTGISPPLSLTVVPSAGGWKGTTNNWNTASNWCNNTVPTSTTDVAISTGVPNQPQITGLSNCRDLIINPGALVTINASNSLSVFGSLTNNGTFTTNTSTVTLSGSAQQTVSGSGTTDFNNLTINNSSVSSPQILLNTFSTIQGTLTMTAGDVNLSGYNLTLGLNAGVTGTLTYTSGKLFNGDFTRWVSTPVIPDLDTRGLFPMGTFSSKRPVYISFPSTAPTSMGTIRVGQTSASTTSTVSITDGASTIVRRQDSFWKIAIGNGLTGGTINLRAGGTGFGTVGALSDLRVMLAAGAASGANSIATGSLTDFLAIRTGLSAATLNNTFYIGSINAVQSPLPITLLSFNATLLENSVNLEWVTTSEKNFDYFQIERAAEDLVFKPISRVSAKGGVNVKTTYNYEDRSPVYGKNYYRLKHVDFDGTFDYSPVVYVLWETDVNDILLYPNPIANREFTLEINKETSSSYITMKLVNSLGLQLMERQVISNKELIALQDDLKPGVYFLKIAGTDFNRTIKVIIQ